MTYYYNRSGEPLTVDEWMDLYRDKDYKRVAFTKLDGGVEVSTVWLGLDHGHGDEMPLIFESMIFDGDFDGDQWRYTTEAEATAGHERIVAALQAGETP